MEYKEIKKAVEVWLRLDERDQKYNCPFVKLHLPGEEKDNICKKYFPGAYKKWETTHSYLLAPCPCLLLSHKYVIKKLRRLVKEHE